MNQIEPRELPIAKPKTVNEVLKIVEKPARAKCKRCEQEFETVAMHSPALREPLVPMFCPACVDARDVETKRQKDESVRRQTKAIAAKREANWASLCPKQYRLKSESDGETDLVKLSDTQPKLCQLIGWKYQSRGLIIRGSTGKGKTRSVWRLLRYQFVAGKRIVAMTAAEFDRECRDAGGKFTLTEWFNRLARADLLFLDDLGKANWTLATEAQWFDLVEHRTRDGRPVIITTNDDGDSLAARMTQDRGEPMIRRLRDYCECIVFE